MSVAPRKPAYVEPAQQSKNVVNPTQPPAKIIPTRIASTVEGAIAASKAAVDAADKNAG